ncbi:MAG: peptidase domain-containing ABC transporter, partial [Paraclostridium sp.]
MKYFTFFNRNKLPVVYQAEASECGLTSILMIALYHGHELSLPALRMKYGSHSMGSRLSSLIDIAMDLNFKSRAVKIELEEIINLSTPCILHWNLSHFVVLKEVKRNTYIIHDPALGRRVISKDVMSNSFTGVALELSPNGSLVRVKNNKKITISDMIKWMPNINRPLMQLLFFSILIELISIVSPLYMQFIIDGVLIDSDKDLLITIILSSLAVLLINVLIISVRSWCTLVLSTSININWLRAIFHHLLSLPVSFFEKRQIGDITSRFNSAASIQQTLTNYFIESFLDGVMAIGTFLLMLVYSVKLTMITIFSIFTYTLLRLVWYRYLKDINEEQLIINAKEDSYFIESLRGIHTIKSFRRESEREVSWANIIIDQVNVSVKLERLSILYRVISTLTSGVNQSFILWLGASLVMENSISIGMYMAYMAYSIQFSSRMSALIDNIVSLKMIRL